MGQGPGGGRGGRPLVSLSLSLSLSLSRICVHPRARCPIVARALVSGPVWSMYTNYCTFCRAFFAVFFFLSHFPRRERGNSARSESARKSNIHGAPVDAPAETAQQKHTRPPPCVLAHTHDRDK
jgi:hypothetical protein